MTDPDQISAVGSIASVVMAAIAAAIAVLAWRAAVNSARAADALTRIERVRLHAELRPEFLASVRRGAERIYVDIELVGPPAIARLDFVEPRIRPIHRDSSPKVADTARRVEQLIGRIEPYEFVGDADRADSFFNDCSLPLTNGEVRTLSLVDAGQVRADKPAWPDSPIRLELVCRYHDFDPWVIPLTLGPKD